LPKKQHYLTKNIHFLTTLKTTKVAVE